MNQLSFLKVTVFAALALLGAGLAKSSAQDSSGVIYSNDFAVNPLTPDGFTATDPQAIVWTQDAIHDGKGSLKLTNTDKTKIVSAIGAFVPFTGGALHVSVEAKTDGIVGGAQPWEKASVQIYYFDQNKTAIDYKWKNYSDTLPFAEGTQDWQTYDKAFFIPTSTQVAFIQIRFNLLRSTGTAWIDKIRIASQ